LPLGVVRALEVSTRRAIHAMPSSNPASPERRAGSSIRPVPHTTLTTDRLELVPMTLALAEAVILGRRDEAERHLGATLPEAWPGRALVERAFSSSLDAIRADPDRRLWGDRVMISRAGPRRVIGSVVFHGAPEDGVVEVAYGVEQESQQQGYATEGTRISVEWALATPGVRLVRATTPSWHVPSRRVLEKCGFVKVGSSESEAMLGELLEFERRGP
jgi:RimJ/RimL family protein N-acetyltransferase